MRDTPDQPPSDAVPARLAALADYAILDTAAEAGFDDLVAIAARMCEAPIALVSLIDADRQWFKARIGLDVCETPIGQSVCTLGLSARVPLIIPDLTEDARTRDNPLVTSDPHIRFYAGAPLVTPQDVAVGMLCVIDTKPRPKGLTADQRATLEALARQVVAQLELRRRDARTMRAEEAGGVGTFELDIATQMLSVSSEFCRIFGMAPTTHCPAALLESLVDPRDADYRSNAETRSAGSAEQATVYRIRRADDGAVRWISRRAQFVRAPEGQAVRMFGAVQDVTDQYLVNEEIAHRLKNTLSLVQAIATQTLKSVSDRAAVRELDARLAALGAAHDVLIARARASGSIAATATAVIDALGAGSRVTLEGPDIDVSSQTTLTLAMLIHELATNATKYGGLSVASGGAALRWQMKDDELVLDWSEHGGPAVTPPSGRGFGSRLIARGLSPSGRVAIDYAKTGLTATIAAPLKFIRA